MPAAPEWTVSEWLNVADGFAIADLYDKVVLAAAFQMLCPGCVEQTIPQLKRAAALFPRNEVAVVGLHTVFEHHDAMTPTSLRAFLHEYRIDFPVAIDVPRPSGGGIPTTMARYGMQGTPTMLLYGRNWELRCQTFGHVPDLQIGFDIAKLVLDPVAALAHRHVRTDTVDEGACDSAGCRT